MSSTNRGSERSKCDYYVTPIYAIRDFLHTIAGDISLVDSSTNQPIILDPCAGGDSENPMSYPTAIKEVWNIKDQNLKTIDIREDSLAEVKGDYLNIKLNYKPDIIITNPPFYLAMEIIQKALEDVAENGLVIMLLRLNFLGSQSRKEFLQTNLPSWIYVHSKRMTFTKNGGTDSIEYAHFIWQKDAKVNHSKLVVI